MDPVRWQCKALDSPDPADRHTALDFLHHEFVEESWVRYKHVTEAHRRELQDCMAGVARLLADPDPEVRQKARRTLEGLARHGPVWSIGAAPGARAGEGVRALLGDAERLWRGTELSPDEAPVRASLLYRDLALLARFGPAAKAALPLTEAILAAPDLPLRRDGFRESGRHPRLPDPFRTWEEDPPVPTVQDAAADLKWSIEGGIGAPPSERQR
jgi:hypothetical protein